MDAYYDLAGNGVNLFMCPRCLNVKLFTGINAYGEIHTECPDCGNSGVMQSVFRGATICWKLKKGE